jgi:hypothetical protein
MWVGTRSRTQHLRRLSIVFSAEIRLKIVTELYVREMSAKQFYDEFGGGSHARVARHFEALLDGGWLRYMRSEGPGGKRRGAKEDFYRATELAYCDADTWALLPYSLRVASSWNAFREIAERVREAMDSSAFRAQPDRHLTCTELLLDQLGWERIIGAIDAALISQFEEQEDSRRRCSHSGEELIRANSILMAFEAPQGSGVVGPQLEETDIGTMIPFPVRLSKVFADEPSMQIIAEANKREISPTLFHRQFGGASIGGIRRRFRMLAEIGWLKRTEQKTGGRRRGAREQFYRATGPAILKDGEPWADVPESLAGTSSWLIFERLSEQVKEAMVAGTFDGRKDRYLAWSLLGLDRLGWEKVSASVEALHALVLNEQKQARQRMDSSGEQPVGVTVALGAFAAGVEPRRH